MRSVEQTLPTSNHFRLQALADGVYVALATPGSGALGNAGIIDLGDRTLIFDTFWTPQAALDLRVAAEQLTGRRVTYVVNSHADGDHVYGNQVFADATIIATPETRAAIAGRGAAFIAWAQSNDAAYMRTREAYVASIQDPERHQAQALSLATQKELSAALPTFELTLPTLTFEQTMFLHGSRHSVELLCLGGGHSESDTWLLLPEEKIAFMGDLLFVKTHPSTWKGNPREWINILELISVYDLATLVPGHGPVGTMDDLRQLQELLREMLHQASAVVERKGAAADAELVPVPPAYADWQEPELFARNMRFMHEVLAKRELVLEPLPPKVKRDAQGKPIRVIQPE